VFNVGLLVLVKVDLDEAGSVEADAGTLADDLCGEAQVIQDSLVHGSQGTAAGTLLLVLRHQLAGGLRQDAPLQHKTIT
jgi:hypothetical protein